MLLDWVQYHDVLMRFSQLHWHREPALLPLPSRRYEFSSETPIEVTLIELLDQVISSTASDLTEEADHTPQRILELTDARLRSLRIPPPTDTITTTLELYRLSILIYLNRIRCQRSFDLSAASISNMHQSKAEIKAQLHSQVDQAFALMSKVESCNRHFPIFILGCEARSDEQRAVILDTIARSESRGDSRSFAQVRMLLETMWAQDDLSILSRGTKPEYSARLTAVVNRARVMPTFV